MDLLMDVIGKNQLVFYLQYHKNEEAMEAKRDEFWLFFVLMIAMTPLAFLLMPVIAAAVFVGGLVLVVVSVYKHYGTPTH